MISMRYQKDRTLRLSMHYRLLDYPDCIAELQGFARTGGRGRYPALDQAIHAVYKSIHGESVIEHDWTVDHELQSLDRIGSDFDFDACFEGVYRDYFADLPKPGFEWARMPPNRDLKSIRFGSYYRDRRCVYLNPRLDQPWVARVFVEHIIHHELCHHRQMMQPLRRREASHSPRFKKWERSFPHFDEARRWERFYLKQILAKPGSIQKGLQERFLSDE